MNTAERYGKHTRLHGSSSTPSAAPERAPMQFTIDQIAHFDRTLFPGDFEKDLMRHGVPEFSARFYGNYIARNRQAGIVGFYQEFVIHDPSWPRWSMRSWANWSPGSASSTMAVRALCARRPGIGTASCFITSIGK